MNFLALAEFVLTLIFMISFGGVLYLLVRGMSRFEEEARAIEAKSLWDRLVKSGGLERIDGLLRRLMIRFLRRSKLILLRLDNLLTGWLKNMRSKTGDEASALEFKEMTGVVGKTKREDEEPLN